MLMKMFYNINCQCCRNKEKGIIYLSGFYFNIIEILTSRLCQVRDSPGWAGVNQPVVQLPSSGVSISLVFSSLHKHYGTPTMNPFVGRSLFLILKRYSVVLLLLSLFFSHIKVLYYNNFLPDWEEALPTNHAPGCTWHRLNELAFLTLSPILKENISPSTHTQ